MVKTKQLSRPSPYGSILFTVLAGRVSRPHMAHQTKSLTSVLVLFFLALPALRTRARDMPRGECYTVALSEPIFWATSGAWSEDQSMETSSIVMVPAAWLERSDRGRLDAESKADCMVLPS